MIQSIAVDITNHCNFDCVHCLRDKRQPRAHMPPELLALVLRQTSSIGRLEVCLTGGEPSLHPELNRVLSILAENERPFSLVSNGFLFEERILSLLDHKIRPFLSGVCFSLDGATAADHDRIRREGSFDRVLASMDACRREKIPLSVKSIVHRENRDTLADTAGLCASQGAHSLGYVLLTPTPRLLSAGLMPTSEEYGEVIRYIRGRLMPSFAMAINIEGYSDPEYRVPFCNPSQGLAVDHEGNLIFCCNLSHPTAGDRASRFGKEFLGNIRDIGIEEGVLRHYRTFAWFMDRVMAGKGEERRIVNCVDCFELFGKLDWMTPDESADHRHR